MKLTADVIKNISTIKDEPEWMREFRLNSFSCFDSCPTLERGRFRKYGACILQRRHSSCRKGRLFGNKRVQSSRCSDWGCCSI